MADVQQIDIPDGIDIEKAIRMIKWIIEAEAENSKTNKYNEREMIQTIAKHIQGDVKCL